MGRLSGRISRLEKQAGPKDTLIMMQDLNDRELFHSNGREYRQGSDNWPDETKFHIVRAVWVDNWKEA